VAEREPIQPSTGCVTQPQTGPAVASFTDVRCVHSVAVLLLLSRPTGGGRGLVCVSLVVLRPVRSRWKTTNLPLRGRTHRAHRPVTTPHSHHIEVLIVIPVSAIHFVLVV